MKLSQAIATEYRGNLTFHTQDVFALQIDLPVHFDVEQSFDLTFGEACDCRVCLRRSLWCEDCIDAERARWGHD
jgi:hypothetical protein